jgi:uncharacterized protein YndB with AHSA1/START domain
MTTRSVTHSTVTLEREYDAGPAEVFRAWSDPAMKARWFAGDGTEHALDFRVGGLETARGHHDGNLISFDTTYHEIVTDERICYTSTMTMSNVVTTTSLTTIEFVPNREGTRMVLTEHGAYLDGHELPEWREEGTSSQLDNLAKALADASPAR